MSHVSSYSLLLEEEPLKLNNFVDILLQELFQLEQLSANDILRVLLNNVLPVRNKLFTSEQEYLVTMVKLTDYLCTFLNGRENICEWLYLGEGMLYRSTEEEIELEYYHCETIEPHDFVRLKQLYSCVEQQYTNKIVCLNAFNVLTGARYSIRTSKHCC